MSPFSRSNKGYKHQLIVIDAFSKYGWIVPLKTKTGKEVALAFLANSAPIRLWTDKGTEFYNHQLKAVTQQRNPATYQHVHNALYAKVKSYIT